MNDKKYKGISGATVVVFIAVIFFVLWMTSRVQMRGQEITFTQFEQEIKDDNVTEVVINQNKAVPTGVVTLTLRDSRETGRVNVSDVNETQKLLDKNDVEYRISAIPQEYDGSPGCADACRIHVYYDDDEQTEWRCQCKSNEFWKKSCPYEF